MCEKTITLINGNGQSYERDLPRLVILGFINEVALQHIEDNTGLKFIGGKFGGEVYEALPQNANQIVALFMTYNFKTRHYDNASVKNTIYLKNDHHVGFDVDSICFECVKENNIVTNGLKDGDRLAC